MVPKGSIWDQSPLIKTLRGFNSVRFLLCFPISGFLSHSLSGCRPLGLTLCLGAPDSDSWLSLKDFVLDLVYQISFTCTSSGIQKKVTLTEQLPSFERSPYKASCWLVSGNSDLGSIPITLTNKNGSLYLNTACTNDAVNTKHLLSFWSLEFCARQRVPM